MNIRTRGVQAVFSIPEMGTVARGNIIILCSFSMFRFKPGPRMGLIQEETDGRQLWI